MNAYNVALLALAIVGAILAALTHDAIPIAWAAASALALAADLVSERARPACDTPDEIYIPTVKGSPR